MSDFKGVTVYCELKDGALLPIAREALGIGRKLASDLGQELASIIIGASTSGMATQTAM